MESQPQNPKFRNNPKNCHLCSKSCFLIDHSLAPAGDFRKLFGPRSGLTRDPQKKRHHKTAGKQQEPHIQAGYDDFSAKLDSRVSIFQSSFFASVDNIGVVPIMHLRTCVIKNSNIQGMSPNVVYYKELLLKERIRSLWEQILSFKRSSHFEKGNK